MERAQSEEAKQNAVERSGDRQWRRWASRAAQGLVVFSLIYASWRYGATDPVAICHLAILLGAASLLAMAAAPSRKRAIPGPLLAIGFVWIAYAFWQGTVLPGWVPRGAPGVAAVHQQWGQEPGALLREAIGGLGGEQTSPVAKSYGSVMPEESRQAIVPFLLAFAVAILSALLFTSKRSRRFLLWSVVINATALAFWGIVQKAGGGQQILPGIENRFSSSLPFASFIYKNAGAAALLPGIAAVAALIYGKHPRREGVSDSETNSLRRLLLEPRNLTLACLVVLILVGLFASLSRGAWFAGLAAIVAVAGSLRLTLRRRDWIVISVGGAASMLAIIGLTGIGSEIRTRAGEVTLQRVSADQRWEQWADGLQTAVAHFPAGSGLGTYGYATLPHQSDTRRSWFREAHNQFLEVATESGAIGVLLVTILLIWIARTSWILLRGNIPREQRSWGLMGMALLTCGACQSLVDFVIVIPANLLLYATLIGVVAATRQMAAPEDCPMSSNRLAGRLHGWFERMRIANIVRSPLAGVGIAILLSIVAFPIAARQANTLSVLSADTANDLAETPSLSLVDQRLVGLASAIEIQPGRAQLFQRRAAWHLARYRWHLIDEARQEGVSVEWQQTRIETLFGVISSQSGTPRQDLLGNLRATPELRDSLTAALQDLHRALELEPLTPNSHLLGGALSPLTEMQVMPWLRSTAHLVNNSAEMLYLNGLFAMESGHTDVAIDQWSKSLDINHDFLSPIFTMARERLTPLEVVTRLVPDNRPDLCVGIVADSAGDSGVLVNAANGNQDDSAGPIDRQLSESIIEHLQNRGTIESGRRHATIARIRQLAGEWDSAAVHWEQALRIHPRDSSFRLEYALVLRQLGRHDEALRQAVLGQTLNPVDVRFPRLTSQIRRDIRVGARR